MQQELYDTQLVLGLFSENPNRDIPAPDTSILTNTCRIPKLYTTSVVGNFLIDYLLNRIIPLSAPVSRRGITDYITLFNKNIKYSRTIKQYQTNNQLKVRYSYKIECDLDDLDYIIWGDLFLRNIDNEIESYIRHGNLLRVNYIGFDMDMHTSLPRLADWVYTKEAFLADLDYLCSEID